jgi:hypothetical protein
MQNRAVLRFVKVLLPLRVLAAPPGFFGGTHRFAGLSVSLPRNAAAQTHLCVELSIRFFAMHRRRRKTACFSQASCLSPLKVPH